MNIVILSGQYYPREPKDGRLEFSIRESYKKQGEWQSAFHSCVAFGQSAEFIQQYFQAGEVLDLQGHLSTVKKETDAGSRTYTNVVVDRAVFPPKAKAKAKSQQADAFDPFGE